VYQAAREAARRIFAISKTFPPEERDSLTDQIRKSSRAVKAMIAEAGPADVIKRHSSTRLMKQSAKRTRHNPGWMTLSTQGGLSQEDFQDLDARYQATGGMLSRMIDRDDDFCKHGPATDYRSIVRDDGEPLFTDH
jgi:four helix bundle protein